MRNSSGTYNKTISTGSTFTFTGLEPGAYFLKEVTAPDSYVGLNKEIAIDIFDNGSVSIEDHTLITKSVNLNGTENLITMKVKNGSIIFCVGGKSTSIFYQHFFFVSTQKETHFW
ncbi:prealbumin-like fold domain-containing protein [Enterococcus avium]|uniref:prealbumin-like fold domain-containing protein n=1 Tax=Enterococcus avium TaxID=33945 RepID=UPI00288FED2C|nr:prealbumin-like fold domain-containing protein [Enterococcus avium]MDT2389525.1 prealbumin-like fold domain-containing protein [Enterococcus avium]